MLGKAPMEKEAQFKKAETILREGGVVAIPTETVYGLAARVDRIEGIRRIFATKERPSCNPLIVHIAEYNQIVNLASHWPLIAEVLSKKFWPGPLSIIVEKKDDLNPLITGNLPTVAIRMPSHPVARALLRRVKVPLAAPSANISTKTSPTSAEHVRKGLSGVFVLDGGDSQFGLESTVIRIEGEKVLLLRSGIITKEDLEKSLQEAGFSAPVLEEKNSTLSPGTSLKHYQPDKPLICFDVRKSPGVEIDDLLSFAEKKLSLSSSKAKEIKLHKDPLIAAHSIYRDLHHSSTHKTIALFFVVRTPHMEGGVWEAVWDRLKRASSHSYVAGD